MWIKCYSLRYPQYYKAQQQITVLIKRFIVNENLINNVFNSRKTDIPVWFLRQSGRHIPEYFEIREKEHNFIKFCLNKDLIIESTKLPLKYYNLDAAIVFSDI